jgi:hypothetical protein
MGTLLPFFSLLGTLKRNLGPTHFCVCSDSKMQRLGETAVNCIAFSIGQPLLRH